MEKRGVPQAAATAPLVAVSEVMKMVVIVIVIVAVLSLGECIVPVAAAVPVVVPGFVRMLVMMRVHTAEVTAKLGKIPVEMAIGCVKTVSHGSLPQE